MPTDTRTILRRSAPLFGLAFLAVVPLASDAAQDPATIAASDKRFEVASVRENTSGLTAMRLQILPGGRFRSTNTPLGILLMHAFGITNDRNIVNGPDWVRTARFDINAKAPDSDLPRSQVDMRAMLTTMLVERFALKARRLQGTSTGFVLLRDSPVALGERLRVTTTECGVAEPSQPLTGRGRAGTTTSSACRLQMDPGEMVATGQPVRALAQILSTVLKAYVIDRTGLDGRYDFSLSWAPDVLAPTSPVDDRRVVPAVPDLFTAVREQLGLRLAEERVPSGAIFIESIERPTPD